MILPRDISIEKTDNTDAEQFIFETAVTNILPAMFMPNPSTNKAFCLLFLSFSITLIQLKDPAGGAAEPGPPSDERFIRELFLHIRYTERTFCVGNLGPGGPRLR